MTQLNFYGRKSELQTLTAFYANASTNLGVIYGRRRVGKSLLIKESLKRSGLPFIYLACKQTSEENNLRQMMSLLGLKLGIPPLAVDKFEDAVDFLFKFCKSDATVLVLDEYPFLRDLIPGFDNILQALVDRYKGESKLKIILCGSRIDVMKGMLAYKGPLYGRSSFVVNLHPMDYYESADFYSSYSNEEKIRIYSVLGGIPYYNSLIDPSISVEENIIRLFLLPEAILSNEVTLVPRCGSFQGEQRQSGSRGSRTRREEVFRHCYLYEAPRLLVGFSSESVGIPGFDLERLSHQCARQSQKGPVHLSGQHGVFLL